MKTGTMLFAIALALLCAGMASAEDRDSYRSKLLTRKNSDYEKNCKSKSSFNYNDCMTTQFFLDDIFNTAGNKVPKDAAGKDLCPTGAHINYAFGDDNAKEITLRCTVKS
jgi:hypothetical protein